ACPSQFSSPNSRMKYTVHNSVAPSGRPLDTYSRPAFADVFNPGTGEVIAQVPLSTANDVDTAVTAASAAHPAWAAIPIKERVQPFFKYKQLLEKHIGELAALISEENGKTDSEARAEVLKAVELTEFACSLPQIASGEVLEVSRGVECRMERVP